MHVACAFRAWGRFHYNNAVCTNACVAVAQSGYLLFGKFNIVLHCIKKNKVVSKAMKFPELMGCHHRSFLCARCAGAYYFLLTYAPNISNMFREGKIFASCGEWHKKSTAR
jgi:hypothetical protein